MPCTPWAQVYLRMAGSLKLFVSTEHRDKVRTSARRRPEQNVRPCRLTDTSGGSQLEFYAFDAAYLHRLREGDEVTEQHFVNYFSELIALKLRSRLQSPQAIQDVKQETFARIFTLLRKEGAVHRGESLGALVNSICNNVLFEQYRSSRRAEPLEEAAAATLLDPQPDALRQAISQQTRVTVHKVLDSLGERDRNVLRSIFVEERDKDAICAEFGVDRGYLRVLVHRAKKAFHDKYDPGFNAGRFP